MDNSIAPSPASHVTPGIQTITKDEWQKKYWFNSLQMITVLNPKPDAWPFMVEMRHFNINGGATERFPGTIANVYLDQMSKILAQDDDRLGYMTDPNLMKIYYDQLIVDVEDLITQSSVAPAYLPAPIQSTAERAPWDASVGERASDIAPNPVITPSFPEPPEPEKTAVPAEKTFEQDGSKYKIVVSGNGHKLHYKDDKPINAADYNKAASLL
jgi:hypothetical protein